MGCFLRFGGGENEEKTAGEIEQNNDCGDGQRNGKCGIAGNPACLKNRNDEQIAGADARGGCREQSRNVSHGDCRENHSEGGRRTQNRHADTPCHASQHQVDQHDACQNAYRHFRTAFGIGVQRTGYFGIQTAGDSVAECTQFPVQCDSFQHSVVEDNNRSRYSAETSGKKHIDELFNDSFDRRQNSPD